MATRRERVILDLEDNFSTKMARAAAITSVLNKELHGLDGTSVETSKSTDRLGDSLGKTGKKTKEYSLEQAIADERTTRLRKSLRDEARAALDAEQGLSQLAVAARSVNDETHRGGSELDRYSGRLRTIADAAAILGPGLIPITAIGVPAVAGLAAELGSVALAGGTAILAFQGVGDALKAVNEAAIDPTSQNLEKAREAMELLSPAAQRFVNELSHLQPVIDGLQGAAASGLFPGLGEALEQLSTAGPQVEQVLFRIGQTMGSLASDAADSLTGPRWEGFIEFVQNEAPRALAQLGHSIGAVAHGLAELTVASAPLSRTFGDWMLRAAEGFDRWATGLSKTQGYHEFLDYLSKNGPLVADAMSSIGNALLQVVEASAPLGGPVLRALTAVADAIATIADSNAGPAIMATVSALALLNRSQAVVGSLGETSWGKAIKGADGFTNKLNAARPIIGRSAIALGGLGIAASGIADGFGLANTATGAMLGALGGPWGAAVGGAIGLVLDLSKAQEDTSHNVADLTATFDQQTGAITENTRVKIASRLQDDGLLDAAEQLGLKTSDITDAIMGQADAQQRLNMSLAGYDTDYSITSADDLRKSFSEQEVQAILTARAATQLRDAIPGMSSDFSEASGNARQLAGALGGTNDQLDQGASAARTFRQELDHLNNVLERRASARDYQAALDDFTNCVKENGKTLDINSEKGRANQAALDNIAATAGKVAQCLHGTARVEALTQARKDFVDAAAKILGSRDAAQQLANKLGLLNRAKAEPKVTADTASAQAKINDVRAGLNSLHDRTITITTIMNRRGGVTSTAGGHSAPLEEHRAGGGHIRGPGGPTEDLIPAMLSNGEFVMRTAAVDKYGLGLMESLNALELARGGIASQEPWALAAGGTVASSTRPVVGWAEAA